MRIMIQPLDDAATELGPTANFGEPLLSYTTLLFERAVEADLPTVRQQSFSHAKPMRQRRLPR